MKSEHPPYLPNPTQHLLMKAALMKEEKATQAWQAWKSTVDLDDIDYRLCGCFPCCIRT